MSSVRRPFIILPGAGGEHEMLPLTAVMAERTDFQPLCYPGWDHFVAGGFSGETLTSELTRQIESWVPSGPIRIAGYSLGGHLGYTVALNLQSRGRHIAGLCSIDAALRTHPVKTRLALIRDGQIGELLQSVISGVQNTVVRLTPRKTRAVKATDSASRHAANMIMWLEDAFPWLESIDRNPVPLLAPTAFLRTWPTAAEDSVWLRRCPSVQMHRLPGIHTTVFDPKNAAALGEAFIAATQDWH